MAENCRKGSIDKQPHINKTWLQAVSSENFGFTEIFGFLNYLNQIKNQNQEKLFPNLKKMKSTGYGTMISRWFRKHLIRLGIKKKGKNFHSFRYTVVNKLTNQKVYEPFIRELIGHSHGSITLDVYGGRKPLSVLLNECVVKIGACWSRIDHRSKR